MRRICRFSIFIFILGSASMFAARAQAQDEPSLGDVARQTREQKQQKDMPAKDAQPHRTSHVITDDEIPQYPVSGVKTPASPTSHVEFAPDPAFGGKMSPDAIRSQIQDKKSGISALQAQITELNGSIHFAGANCVANCALWNDSQQQKQRQVEDMRSELENAKQALEQMQDYARKMGFGSSVYDAEQ